MPQSCGKEFPVAEETVLNADGTFLVLWEKDISLAEGNTTSSADSRFLWLKERRVLILPKSSSPATKGSSGKRWNSDRTTDNEL